MMSKARRVSLPRKARKVTNYLTLIQPTVKIPRNKLKEATWSPATYFELDILQQREVSGRAEALVHYKGWSKKYDEWRPLSDILETPASLIEPDASEHFRIQLAIEIKEQLNGHRKTDSFVEIKIPVQKDTFNSIAAFASFDAKLKKFTVKSFTDLNEYLGKGWHYRILNAAGDFCFIIPGSLWFWLYERRPLTEFATDGSEKITHRGFVFSMRFVKDNGTKHDLAAIL